MSANRLLQHLRDFIRRQGGGSGVSDGQLLERFVKERDETAFEVLVWRHGPMVLALGRRVLGNDHDAEDVLQATFLTLVRKAGSIGKCESLSSWLYKVAYRIALRSQERAAKMAADGRLVEDVPAPPQPEESVWHELRPLLDAAIERLPEKYRTAIVLCDLQGKTHREAAEQLGCAVGTISTRVLRARQMLRKRLAHHGLSVSIGVLSAALAQRTASALPTPLTAATVRAAARLMSEGGAAGIVSASVAELIEGANRAMLMNRFKIVMLLALAAGGTAVGVGVTARREPPTPTGDPPPTEAATKAPADKPAETVTVRGRVLNPDGKPVQGARLYYPRLRTTPPRSEEDIEYPQRGKTDAEGRFRFELPRTDLRAEFKMTLIAAADGFGADWTVLSADNVSAELMLRLVKDLPIDGRIVSTEGKPLPGIRVGVVQLAATSEGKIDPFLTAWKQQWGMAFRQTPKRLYLPMNKIFSATTDKDGRFRLGGVGVERVAQLQARGPGISQGSLYIINRDGFDPVEINKTVMGRLSAEERRIRQPPQLYGPKLTYVAESSRRIEGCVREAGSSKPVSGVCIMTGAGYNNPLMALTDKDGRYHLDGLPKMKEYLLNALPPENTSWLRAGARVPDKEGLQPIAVDFTVARGILVSGRVLDRTTGKGVKGAIRFVPLPGNKFAGKPGYDSYKYEGLVSDVGVDGRFKLAVMPGPCVLMVHVDGRENGGQELNPYKQAEFDAKDQGHVKITKHDDDLLFAAIDNQTENLTFLNAVKVIELAPDAGTATCDVFVERGQTMTVKIEDRDGKPLKGTTVAGVTAGWPTMSPIEDASCTVFALDPKKPRRLLFFHAQRGLAGSLTVRGDEKEPPVARLGPVGSVIGRVLDRDGQPLAGANINLNSPERIVGELYRQMRQRQQAVRTGKDGRFRLDGIVPEAKFSLGITQGRTYFIGEPRIGARQVKAGETLDLGEIRVKPGP